MLADGGPPLFFSLMKPASYYELKSKKDKKFWLVQKKKRRGWHYDWGVSQKGSYNVRSIKKQHSSFFLTLGEGRELSKKGLGPMRTEQHNKHDEMKKNEREASEEGLTNYLLVFG